MTMVKKIILFVENNFSNRDYERFGIEVFLNNGFKAEVWDFTPFLHRKFYHEAKSEDSVKYNKIFVFQTKNEALTEIRKLSIENLIICELGYNLSTYFIYKAISRMKLPYCISMSNALPFSGFRKKLSFSSLYGKLRDMSLLELKDFVFRLIPYRYIGVKPVDFVLAGGEKSLVFKYPRGPQTQILWLHTLDYDIYLREKQNIYAIDNNCGVFLDEYLPFHSDYLQMGIGSFSSSEEYYPLLCRFFDFLEKTHDTKIMIAAHPRSHYESHPDYFKNRPVIKGRTLEMVKRSRFVITHSSTSVNFAVLCKKPIIFITTNSLQQSMKGQWIEVMASALGKKVININENKEVDFGREMVINETSYANYKNAYIKKEGSEELPFWQIFSSYLKNLDKT